MASYRRWEDYLDEILKDPERAVGYLNACLEDYDPEAFRRALRDVVRARDGVECATTHASLGREVLDRMLSENGDPDLQRLEAILDALGFRLSISLKEAS